MSEFPLDRAFLWLISACAATYALLPICIRAGGAIGMVDAPERDERRIHRKPIPRVGGLAIAGIFLPLAAAVGFPSARDPWFIAGYLLLIAAGVADDRRGLRPWVKFSFQAMAMAAAVAGAGLVAEPIPLLVGGWNIGAHWACAALTVFIGVGMINALNLIDGLDGLAAGVTAVTAAAFAVLAALAENVPLCLAASILSGCVIAILGVNAHPARIFLGDTGSMLLGYLLSCLGLALVAHPDPAAHGAYSIFLPLLLLVIPWSDALWVMGSRVLRRRDPFDGDRTHVHHQMLGLGIRHRYAVLIILALDAGVAALAIAVRSASDGAVVAIAFATVGGITAGIRYLARDLPTRRLYRDPARWTRWYERQRMRTPLPERHEAARAMASVARWVLRSAFLGLMAVYLISAARPSGFLGSGAVVMLLLLAMALAATRSWSDHFVAFVAFAGGVYLATASALWLPWQHSTSAFYLTRALLLTAFGSASFELWYGRRLDRLLDTPLELLALAFGAGVIIAVGHRYYFNVLWVTSSGLALFIICKALGAESHPRWFTAAAVGAALVGFALVQGLFGGLLSPFAGG